MSRCAEALDSYPIVARTPAPCPVTHGDPLRQPHSSISTKAFPRKGYSRTHRFVALQSMICPECGAGNRDGASYCDSCGGPLSEAVRALSEGVRASANRSAGFVGLMTLDWTARSALAGIAGILGAVVAASQGAWGFVALFLLISFLGWGFLAYAIRNAP